ncbi:MAG: alpha/beta hydrolase [Desulfosalsimonadaceae bacterium]
MRRKKTAALGMLFAAMMISGCITGMIYYPSGEITKTPADIGLPYESVRIGTSDGVEIHGWWVAAPAAQQTVLFFHGNSGNIGDCLDRIRIIHRLGFNLLIIDYRGFGECSGSPSRKGLYRDADAAMAYLLEEKNVDPESIILWGRSLGGAIAARTAAVHDAGMLILESTFTSMRDAADDISPWAPGWLLTNHAYQTASYLEQIDIPCLVIHSVEDEVIPFHHGVRLYESVRGEKRFLQINGSHNRGFMDSMDVYIKGIREFVGDVKNRP